MISGGRLPSSFAVNSVPPMPSELLWQQQELLQYAEDLKKEMSEPRQTAVLGFLEGFLTECRTSG